MASEYRTNLVQTLDSRHVGEHFVCRFADKLFSLWAGAEPQTSHGPPWLGRAREKNAFEGAKTRFYNDFLHVE